MSDSNVNYIDSNDLVINNDTHSGIHSGGFSVKSFMLKAGLSPIMTLNSSQSGGTSEKVSDLFHDLVVPNWAFSYDNKILGGNHDAIKKNVHDIDDETIDDDLHEKLLDLVKQHEKTKSTKKSTKKMKQKNNNTKKKQFNKLKK
jgi:hypothetical protein